MGRSQSRVAGDDVDGVEYAAFHVGTAALEEGHEQIGSFLLPGVKDEAGIDRGGFFRALLLYMWVAGVWYGSSRLTGPQASMTVARVALALWKP
ncbi:MAG: hypothetical protein ACREQV_14535 [Candidatus Binatia bacterium]